MEIRFDKGVFGGITMQPPKLYSEKVFNLGASICLEDLKCVKKGKPKGKK